MTNEQINAIIRSGDVKRCHTVHTLTNPTVAQHAYGVASLALLLHPNPSRNFIKACLWHDAHEKYTGDIPSPAKRRDEKFAIAAMNAESAANELMDIEHLMVSLTPMEHEWLHALDRLELFLWCGVERAMGNKFVEPIEQRLFDELYRHAIGPVGAFVRDHVRYNPEVVRWPLLGGWAKG